MLQTTLAEQVIRGMFPAEVVVSIPAADED